jgi:hypothetical protein
VRPNDGIYEAGAGHALHGVPKGAVIEQDNIDAARKVAARSSSLWTKALTFNPFDSRWSIALRPVAPVAPVTQYSSLFICFSR